MVKKKNLKLTDIIKGCKKKFTYNRGGIEMTFICGQDCLCSECMQVFSEIKK